MEFERTSPGLYRFLPSHGHPRKAWRWTAIVLLIMALAVLQDYVFSQLRNTGFYLSESLLYSCLWLFFLPLILLQLRILSGVLSRSWLPRAMIVLLLSCVLTLVHLLLFTLLFVTVSALLFTPSHRFLAIFQSVLTNQLYIVMLVYIIFQKFLDSRALISYCV